MLFYSVYGQLATFSEFEIINRIQGGISNFLIRRGKNPAATAAKYADYYPGGPYRYVISPYSHPNMEQYGFKYICMYHYYINMYSYKIVW